MKKILIIDDSKTQLTSLNLYFTRHGFEVYMSENGMEGYKKVVENPPDVVVCDVMMPNLNGYQFCRLLKNNPLTQRIPIILLTSLNQNIDRFWGDKAGADMFLSKNTELNDLLDNINKVIEEKPVEDAIKKTIVNTKALKNALQVKINDVLDTSLMEATIMNEFRKLSKNIESTERFLKSFFELLSSMFNYDLCFIRFNEREYFDKSKIYISSDKYKYSEENLFKIISLTGVGDENNEIEIIETDKLNAEYNEDLNFQTSYILDLKLNDIVLARLCLCSYDVIDYESFQFFETVKNEMTLMAKIRNLYAQTKFLSITDGLTLLYNRRYFFENIEREFQRSKRYKSPLSVAMLDIDFFKKINDTYGHQAGDFVLKNLAEIITNKLRRTDLIFRYGGEEFIIILPETSVYQSYIPLERLRSIINSNIIDFEGEKISYTISIGVAEKTDNVSTTDELIALADKALYDAKHMGRNKVVLYE